MYALFPNEARTYLTAAPGGRREGRLPDERRVHTVKEDESVDVNQIRELIKIVEASDVTEVVVEEGGTKVVVRKGRGLRRRGAGAPLRRRRRRVAEAPAATDAAADAGERPAHWKTVVAPMVGTFYAAPVARRRPVRGGGRLGRRGPDAVHPRGDEAHERDHRRGAGRHPRDRRRERRRRSSTAPCSSTTSRSRRRPRCSIEDPDRQPRRGRAARHPRVQGDGHRDRSPSTRRPTATACTRAWPTRPSASARRRRALSYLNMPNIISAALMTGAEADPPRLRVPRRERRSSRGRAPTRASTFIGPSPEAIERMGDKAVAREHDGGGGRARRCPGSDGPVDERRGGAALRRAGRLTRCSSRRRAGGGGKGMRVAETAERARAERSPPRRPRRRPRSATTTVYLEKYLAAAAPRRDPGARRHARQRRAPLRARLLDPAPPPEARRGGAVARRSRPSCARAMGEAALQGRPRGRLRERRHRRVPARHGRQLLLHGDEHARPGRAPRHRGRSPASTSSRSRSASPPGEPMKHTQPGRRSCMRGHAIEFRINAEDPAHDFRPAPGHDRGLQPARRLRRARRQPRLLGLPRAAALRLAASRSSSCGARRATRPSPRAPGARRVHRRRASRRRSRSTSGSSRTRPSRRGEVYTDFVEHRDRRE